MQAYIYQNICFFKKQKKLLIVMLLLLIPSLYLSWKIKDIHQLEFLCVEVLLSVCQLMSPIYEEDFNTGMIDLQILKEYKKRLFFLQKNGFLLLIELLLLFLIGAFSWAITKDLMLIDVIKFSIITIVESFMLAILTFFLNFIIESKITLQYILGIFIIILAFSVFKHISPFSHFLLSFLVLNGVLILMLIVLTNYIKKKYRLK
ncbi:MAG: hypothetical protein LBS28_00415 [Streptococcaceae bacterium]|jgi:hypothetical protein|nr:hypothetical protein [Streptococcaceae bacterium]